MTTIEQLPAKINTVIEQDATATAAKQQELEAQAALVTRILEILRPAVRALGTRPVIRLYGYAKSRAEWRGVCLSSTGPAPTKCDGEYYGDDVFLDGDGRLVVLQYTGHWNDWQGQWTSVERTITVEAFCRGWKAADPERLLQTITNLISSAGDRVKTTEAAKRRAEKFRALLALAGK